MFLITLEQKGWLDFLKKFNPKIERKLDVDEFKEELWDTKVEFGESFLMATRLVKKAREELLDKIVHMREPRANTGPKSCKDSSTLKEKSKTKKVRPK